MPTIQHNLLTGSELHEPKGISSATAEQVYVSDGAGGGVWRSLVVSGWENYDHSGGFVSLPVGVKTYLTNDAAGAQTDTSYALPGSTGIWDSVNSEFNWSAGGLEVGDLVIARFDLDYTVNSNNDGFLLEMDFGISGGTPLFTLPVRDKNVDIAGTQQFAPSFIFYIGSSLVLNNPAKVAITADSTGDGVQLNGFSLNVFPRTPRYV